MEGLFSGAGGYKAFNPLKAIIDPVIDVFDNLFSYLPYTHIMLMVFSIILMFFALANLIKTMPKSSSNALQSVQKALLHLT
jgi:long-subunit acyl-CoA synthetase (AMP-forming)